MRRGCVFCGYYFNLKNYLGSFKKSEWVRGLVEDLIFKYNAFFKVYEICQCFKLYTGYIVAYLLY
jgi:hypothetical protein